MVGRMQRAGSLTDDEVGIIRNLLARGKYRNQDILGLVNTVRRLEGRDEVNGGRISEVKTNKPRYKGINAASDKDTDAFITRAKKPAGFKKVDTSPVNADILKTLFPMRKGSNDRLGITETDQIECKESFGGQHWITNCIKAIAAFANNNGGYIAFGIKDNTWEIVGIKREKFESYDRRKLNQVLRTSLSCGIEFDMVTLTQAKKTIGVLYIFPARTKPAMFIKQVNGSAEGHIYYRYQGENRLIAPTELQQIIEERIRTLSETILSKHISNILSNGIENSAILNLDSGVVDGKAGSFVIDEELLPKISFIKDGEFVEKFGTPTLKLIGEIKKSAKIVTTKEEELIKLYPYSWQEMVDLVKKQIARATNTQISNLIKSEKLKVNKKYSSFNFRNKKLADKYKRSGTLRPATPSIYNEAAVKFIVDKLSNKAEPPRS